MYQMNVSIRKRSHPYDEIEYNDRMSLIQMTICIDDDMYSARKSYVALAITQ